MKQLIFIISVLIATTISAQNRPFPQRGEFTYAGGYTTNKISDELLLELYNNWKKEYTEFCNETGGIRVLSDQWNGDKRFTVSEGQAYGMLMAAYFGEKEFFDKLLLVYNYPSFQTKNNLMHWRVLCYSVDGQTAATDADQDAALALLVAYEQWRDESYKARAMQVIEAIREHTLYPINYDSEIKWQMRIGDNDTKAPNNDGVITDYYAPAYYRVYAEFEGHAQTWDEHRVSGQAYLRRNVELNGPSTGLNSKIAYPTGISTLGQCKKTGQWGNPCTYNWDASRTPWRQALDVAWYGKEKAASSLQYCNKLTDWIDNSIGIENIKSKGYWPNGIEEYPGSGAAIAFVGGFACGALTYSQDRLDRFAIQALNTTDQSYYGNSLRILYYLLITGNMWKPENNISSSFKVKPYNSENFRIYPNPAYPGQKLTVELSKNTDSPVQISLTDSKGLILYQQKIRNATNLKTLQFEILDLCEGLYFISLNTNSFNKVEKLMVASVNFLQ